MDLRDFSILFEPVQTASSKKDISIVTGFNAITQYIENVMKTQKGELISDMNLGSDYFNYIYGISNKGILETQLAAYLEAAIPKLKNIKVNLIYFSEDQLQFEIRYSMFNGGISSQNNASCFVEVQTT